MITLTKPQELTLVVPQHNEDGEVDGRGVVIYEVSKEESERNTTRVWITVTELDACYPDTVREALKDEYYDCIIEEINFPK